jgi:hypothetical protein
MHLRRSDEAISHYRSHTLEKQRGLTLQQSLIGVIFFGVFSTLAGLTLLHAAEPSLRASYALLQGTNEFSLWAGGSPDSFGNIEGRQVLLVGLRYGRVLAAWDWVSLEYSVSRSAGVRTERC